MKHINYWLTRCWIMSIAGYGLWKLLLPRTTKPNAEVWTVLLVCGLMLYEVVWYLKAERIIKF